MRIIVLISFFCLTITGFGQNNEIIWSMKNSAYLSGKCEDKIGALFEGNVKVMIYKDKMTYKIDNLTTTIIFEPSFGDSPKKETEFYAIGKGSISGKEKFACTVSSLNLDGRWNILVNIIHPEPGMCYMFRNGK